MSPDQELRDFVIVLEPIPAEQLDKIPYWTNVDDVAQIDPSEFVGFSNRPDISQSELPLILELLRRFPPRQNSFNNHTPSRLNSSRTVTFSPRVEIQPIQKNKRHYAANSDISYRPKTVSSQPSPSSININNNYDEHTSSKTVDKSNNSAEQLELLNDDLSDLVPPDFDVIHCDPNKLYVVSGTSERDSDSVSYFSSDDDY